MLFMRQQLNIFLSHECSIWSKLAARLLGYMKLYTYISTLLKHRKNP